MKIGIVSKESHAKTHYAALTRKGYEVSLLGGNPNDIPPTIDVLVVRDASCSTHSRHGGLQWGRDTGKPVIMQNGLSGILRDLEALKDPAPTEEVDAVDPKFENLDTIIEETRALGRHLAHVASRFGMSKGDLIRDLRAQGLYQKVLTALAPPSDDAVATAKTYLDLLLEERPSDPFPEHVDTIHALMEGSLSKGDLTRVLNPLPKKFPATARWAKAVPEPRLQKEMLLGRRFISSLEPSLVEKLSGFLRQERYTKAPDYTGETVVESLRPIGRNPLRVVSALLACVASDPDPILNRKMVAAVYHALYGVGMDTRNLEAMAWAFQSEIPIQVPEKPPVVESPRWSRSPRWSKSPRPRLDAVVSVSSVASPPVRRRSPPRFLRWNVLGSSSRRGPQHPRPHPRPAPSPRRPTWLISWRKSSPFGTR